MLSEVKPEIEAIFKGVFEAYSVPSIPKHVRRRIPAVSLLHSSSGNLVRANLVKIYRAYQPSITSYL